VRLLSSAVGPSSNYVRPARLERHADWLTLVPTSRPSHLSTQTYACCPPRSIRRADCHSIFADEGYNTLVWRRGVEAFRTGATTVVSTDFLVDLRGFELRPLGHAFVDLRQFVGEPEGQGLDLRIPG
jgi:hypothetical protein